MTQAYRKTPSFCHPATCLQGKLLLPRLSCSSNRCHTSRRKGLLLGTVCLQKVVDAARTAAASSEQRYVCSECFDCVITFEDRVLQALIAGMH